MLASHSFYFVGWPHGGGANAPSRASSHIRSLSPSSRMHPSKQVTKSTSTPQLSKMAAMVSSPTPPSLLRTESDFMNTIPDPRTPSPSSAISRHGSSGSIHHPDLSNEVATLSTKLINAINHQTSLDDSLQATRHELEAARERLVQLEGVAKEYAEFMEKGLLIKKEDYDKMEQGLKADLTQEKSQKAVVEKEKRRIESELENLTTALFEEANTMVAAARKETEASEKRNEQLRTQLNDAELLLASHQEQLQDLKAVMQQMSSDRDENETNTHVSTAPSTPAIPHQDKMSRIFESANLAPLTPGSDEIQPDHPLRFSHLIRPVLRTDIQAYKEFQELMKTGRSSAPASRAASGNFSGLNVLGLINSNGSSTSLPTAPPISSMPAASVNSSPRESAPVATSLKDQKFYKRALVEDIEPTLRLDLSPGISWLARRTVINSMTAGSLVVEPHPPISKIYGPVFACALCGENRKGDLYSRKHRFRTSESEDAQRYPLCDFCLGRVRATCDYIGFLRMVRDGHWRAETEEEQKSTWEESVRLRERMFWSRLGGGVVPSYIPAKDSPRSPTFSRNDVGRGREDSVQNDDSAPSADSKEQLKPEEDPFRSEEKEKRVSIGNKVIEAKNESPETPTAPTEEGKDVEERTIHGDPDQPLESEAKLPTGPDPGYASSVYSSHHGDDARVPSVPSSPPKNLENRLSVTVPGAFE